MNSGPSATFGIMINVTNSGSSNRLTTGDQLKMTASATPTRAPSEKPPRISTAVTTRLERQAYLAWASVASVASGEGRMNFGTWNASTTISQSTTTARCTTTMTARDRTDRPASRDTTFSSSSRYRPAAVAAFNLPWPRRAFNHLVD